MNNVKKFKAAEYDLKVLKSEYQNMSTSAEGLKFEIQERDVQLLTVKDHSNN